MTIKQEAYQLIDSLPEDSIRILIQLMCKMEPQKKNRKKNFDFSKFVTPTERAINADDYVRDLRANDRI